MISPSPLAPTTDPHRAAQSDRAFLSAMGIRPAWGWRDWWRNRPRRASRDVLTYPLDFADILTTALVLAGVVGICSGIWIVAWMSVNGIVGLIK